MQELIPKQPARAQSAQGPNMERASMIESKRSESIMNLAAALAVAQGMIKTAAKVNEAGSKNFKYKYSTLDEIWNVCRIPLSVNGLSVIQLPANDKDGFYLETILLHSSGEWISSVMTLPIIPDRMSELQAMGSAITYARRYMLSAMVGITTGNDDDGQANANQEQQPYPQKQPVQAASSKPVSSKAVKEPEKDMNLGKLFNALNKDSTKGFYKNAADTMKCRPTGEIPASDDIDGWNVLYKDAKDYALFAINEDSKSGRTSQNQPPMPVAQAEQAALETETMTDIEADSHSRAAESPMDEIEADQEEIPF